MVQGRALSWLHLTTILLTIISCWGCPSPQEGSQPKSNAFDFTLNTAEGEEIRLQSYRGKKMVHLVFWATWCPACLMEMPKLIKLQQAIGNKPYEILAVNVGLNDSLTRVKLLQERYQMSFKILFDEKGEVSRKYGVFGIPTHIVIDKEGKIRDRFNQLPEDPRTYLNQFFTS